ncbi:MAG: YHS domain-containing protein, partial [Deltaproteobacteria bacterium]
MMKVTDPVCKMVIEHTAAKAASVYKGETVYFCATACKDKFDKNPEAYLVEKGGMAKEKAPVAGEMAKDPICGMVVNKERSIKTTVAGRQYYFCSDGCLRTFEAPEAELKAMKRRVAIALTGVVALALLRAAFFLGLAAGATVLTWVPIPWLPWFTWGVWLFIITTPVMLFGGKGFFIGAYHALKDRSANMDLLIALGTSTAYIYSA